MLYNSFYAFLYKINIDIFYFKCYYVDETKDI